MKKTGGGASAAARTRTSSARERWSRRLLALDRGGQRSDPLLAPTEPLGRLRQLGSRRVPLGLDRFDLAAAAGDPLGTVAGRDRAVRPPRRIGLLACVESRAPSSSARFGRAFQPQLTTSSWRRAHRQPFGHDSQCPGRPARSGRQLRFPWNDRCRGDGAGYASGSWRYIRTRFRSAT